MESLQSNLHQKLDKAALQDARHQLQETRQQGQNTAQALSELQGGVRQQGQEHATALRRLEALVHTTAQGMLRSSSLLSLQLGHSCHRCCNS